MKTKGTTIFNAIRRASVIILALFVVLLISSCSPETMQLCRVGISTEDSTRNLTATIIDPLANYKIYYKCLYKGTGKSYCGMTNENEYRLLDSNGILLSQGLWEINVIFKSEYVGNTYSPTDIKSEITGTSGVIFINLNTTIISINVNTDNLNGKGNITVEYSLKNENVPITALLSNNPLSVDIYKYSNSAFQKLDTTIQITKDDNLVCRGSLSDLEPGIYYAVFTVTGTISQKTGTISVDTIGFVVRGGMTTQIEGECTHSYTPASTSFDVIQKPSPGQNHADIKDFAGSDFKNGTYTIIGGDYTFVSSETIKREKVLSNVNVTINLNGKDVANSNPNNNGNPTRQDTRTRFKIDSNATLTLINNSTTGAASSVFGDSAGKQQFKYLQMYQTNVIINGGAFTIGSSDSNGHISLKGCPAKLTPPSGDILHSAIDLSYLGGTVNLLGFKHGVIIEETAKGIGTFDDIPPETTDLDKTPEFNATINMNNSTILCDGSNGENDTPINPAYGIYLDGHNLDGEINISIKGLDPSIKNKKYSIKTQGSNNESGACIFITNFSGSVNITLDKDAIIEAKDGYAIYLSDTCTGNVTINNYGAIIGSSDGIYISKSKAASRKITINNYGTIKGGKKGITIGSNNAIDITKSTNITIINTDTITGSNNEGINIANIGNGTINIDNSKEISGKTYGISVSNSCVNNTIVENSGSIAGKSGALILNNKLIETASNQTYSDKQN